MDVWYSGDYAVSFYEYGTDENPIGNFIGHTWRDWSLIPTARPFVKPPARKENKDDVKGINGSLDLSNQLLGFPLFNNREGSWTFYSVYRPDSYESIQDNLDADILDAIEDPTYAGEPILASRVLEFQERYSRILFALQGKDVVIILDEDPTYFYKGTVQVEDYVASNDGSLNGVTIKYDLFPYKMKLEETVLVIKDANADPAIDRVGQNIYFSVDSMPVVPRLEIHKDRTSFSEFYRIGFTNPEIKNMVEEPLTGLYYNINARHTDIWEQEYEGVIVPLTAEYYSSNAYQKSRMSFVCSNYYGNNQCYVVFDSPYPSTLSHTQYVALIFREGRL